MLDRRTLLTAAGIISLAAASGAASRDRGVLLREIEQLETRLDGGRFGVALLDSANGSRLTYRATERFPLCSTFKLLLTAAILMRVERGHDRLDRPVPVGADDIVANSPFSRTRVGGRATVAELCLATMTRSDNAAANLLLPAVGGPAGLTRWLRLIGDPTSRLDRIEPALNEARPGDPRDTTTPMAMLATLRRLLLGPTLSTDSRRQLIALLVDNRTGGQRLRAGLPSTWRIGDKTGANDRGTDNIVAILWPPARTPLLVASYITGSGLPLAGTNAVHAALATIIANAATFGAPAELG